MPPTTLAMDKGTGLISFQCCFGSRYLHLLQAVGPGVFSACAVKLLYIYQLSSNPLQHIITCYIIPSYTCEYHNRIIECLVVHEYQEILLNHQCQQYIFYSYNMVTRDMTKNTHTSACRVLVRIFLSYQ